MHTSTYALRPTQRRRDGGVVATSLTDIPLCVLEHQIFAGVVKPLRMPDNKAVKLECFADVVLSICSVMLTCKAFRDAVTEYTWTRAVIWNKVRVEAVWNLNERDFREHRGFKAWITAKRNVYARRASAMRLPMRPFEPPWAAPLDLMVRALVSLTSDDASQRRP